MSNANEYVSAGSKISLSLQSSTQDRDQSSQSNVTILDTDSEEEEIRPRTARRPVIESDTEEEDELDERALSPATRMSITGVRPHDLDDDSSEIESSNQDDSEDSEALGNEKGVHSPRYSTHFASDIQESLHSTIFPECQPTTSVFEGDSSESDVQILENRQTPIEISSSDDESRSNKENISAPLFSPRSSAGAPSAAPKGTKLVQPTIQRGFQNLKVKDEGGLQVPGQVVSRAFHEKETRKLLSLQTEKAEALKLLEKVASKLPDGGAQMEKRIKGLERDIEVKKKYLKGLTVAEEGPGPEVRTQVMAPGILPRKPSTEAPEWDELSAAVNQIKPTHTGSQGMATFNNQKALTMERLKDFHGSLNTCPAENVLADDPRGLKVTLMDHQKHALAWMEWRERQRPRGGILADDMGLGKTLTMISAVLASKNRREEAVKNAGGSSDSEEGENEEGKSKNFVGWSSKGRKDWQKGGTLVVCPASLLRQWEGEVESKVSSHRLTVCVHHGNNRDTKPKHLRTYDIVVTTYNIVAREQKSSGALFGIKWHRIILDEAHVVRNHKAQSSIAVSDLRGKYRWALTGTPIQNKELDVYALLKFLRCSPFDDLATWKRWIDNKSAGGQQRLHMLMKSLMLRRTKAQLQEGGKLNSLPQKEIRLIEITLDKDEMNVYQKIMTYSRTLFAQFLFQRAEKDTGANFVNDANRPTYSQVKDPNGAFYKMHQKFARMHQGNKEVKSHEILVLLLRLRQICCHPGLVDSMLESDTQDHLDNASDSDTPEIDLLAQLNRLAISDTNTSSGANYSGTDDRPLDHEEAKIAAASKNVLKRSNPVFDLKRPSSKMHKILEVLETTILRSTDKAIIVSQWTSVLNILRDHLEEANWQTLSLNGSIPVKNRDAIVRDFNNPASSKRILLLSLTAGGVGLNLVGANHLLLIDLHWNPQLEAQAQDRIYRVGQKKNVIIYKFMCVDTVEQRIKALQDRKLELANGVLTGGKISTKLTIDDLKGLFGL